MWAWPALENPNGALIDLVDRLPAPRVVFVEPDIGPPDPVPAPAFGDLATLRAKAAHSIGSERVAALAAIAFALTQHWSVLDAAGPAFVRESNEVQRSYRELLADPAFEALPTADAELYRAGRAFDLGGSTNKAANAAYERLIARFPSSPLVSAAHLQLANSFVGDRTLALRHYAAAIDHGDVRVRDDARFHRAVFYERSGDHEHALDELVAMMRAGTKEMRYLAAEAAIDPYLALRPGGDPFAFFANVDATDVIAVVGDLGIEYVAHDRFDDAIGVLREVVKRDPAAKRCQYRSALIQALAAKDERAELVVQTRALAANHECNSSLEDELRDLAWRWAKSMPATTEGRRDLLELWDLATPRQTSDTRQLLMIRDRAILAWRVALADSTRSAWATAASALITATVAGDLRFLGPAIDADRRSKRR